MLSKCNCFNDVFFNCAAKYMYINTLYILAESGEVVFPRLLDGQSPRSPAPRFTQDIYIAIPSLLWISYAIYTKKLIQQSPIDLLGKTLEKSIEKKNQKYWSQKRLHQPFPDLRRRRFMFNERNIKKGVACLEFVFSWHSLFAEAPPTVVHIAMSKAHHDIAPVCSGIGGDRGGASGRPGYAF